MELPRPGRVVRAALVIFGLLFLPLAIWFAYANFHRYWLNALALFITSAAFLRWGFSRDENSWVSALDDLDGS